jgi:hypothetical protein
LINCPIPEFLIIGDPDQFVEDEDFSRFSSRLTQPVEFTLNHTADHFRDGFIGLVSAKIADFFVRYL